jgi:hypothetical protein
MGRCDAMHPAIWRETFLYILLHYFFIGLRGFATKKASSSPTYRPSTRFIHSSTESMFGLRRANTVNANGVSIRWSREDFHHVGSYRDLTVSFERAIFNPNVS